MTPRERAERIVRCAYGPADEWGDFQRQMVDQLTTEFQAVSNEQLERCRAKYGPPVLRVQKKWPDATLPTRAYDQAAALDLYVIVDLEAMWLNPGDYGKFRTGVAFEFPAGYFGKIETRSGHSSMGLFTTGGVIDGDYRGEVFVVLHNAGKEALCIRSGDRIAQMLILPVFQGGIEEAAELTPTERGDKGFGSTGR